MLKKMTDVLSFVVHVLGSSFLTEILYQLNQEILSAHEREHIP